MTDPISLGAASIAVAQGGVGFLEFLWSKAKEADVIAALFDHEGDRLAGDDRIVVHALPGESTDGKATLVWYQIVAIVGFEFVPYATNPYLETRLSNVTGHPDRRVWRWVYPPHLGMAHGGRPDAETVDTNFIVIGYKPSAIVRHFLNAAK